MTYAYNLPFTVHAWHRIGIGALILLTGASEVWKNEQPWKTVFYELVAMSRHHKNVAILLLDCPERQSGSLAQYGRLFAVNYSAWDPGRFLVR